MSFGAAPPRNVQGSVRLATGNARPQSSTNVLATASVARPSLPWHLPHCSFSYTAAPRTARGGHVRHLLGGVHRLRLFVAEAGRERLEVLDDVHDLDGREDGLPRRHRRAGEPARHRGGKVGVGWQRPRLGRAHLELAGGEVPRRGPQAVERPDHRLSRTRRGTPCTSRRRWSCLERRWPRKPTQAHRPVRPSCTRPPRTACTVCTGRRSPGRLFPS